ncbi:hypothetical protein OPV22_016321 [Ensete ventricosum]|uniref:Uncharacterized protein n=1 Tax=Ensete ventricosum TaxID=4639 RepID=A0AAV8PDX3_ENSVE|nr:hypothetical protein OPV22_016321 [Ensete ventricosum]
MACRLVDLPGEEALVVKEGVETDDSSSYLHAFVLVRSTARRLPLTWESPPTLVPGRIAQAQGNHRLLAGRAPPSPCAAKRRTPPPVFSIPMC